MNIVAHKQTKVIQQFQECFGVNVVEKASDQFIPSWYQWGTSTFTGLNIILDAEISEPLMFVPYDYKK